MLHHVQSSIDELSSFLQNFSQNNHLSVCNPKSCPQWPIFLDTNKCTNNFIKCELKSTEKQQFDIRLLFNSLQLKDWWPNLSELCRQLVLFEWMHCPILTAIVVDKIHCVDIQWVRKINIDHFLLALCNEKTSAQTARQRAVVIKLNSSNQQNVNFFSKQRITLTCSIIQNLLSYFGTSTVGSSHFNQFAVDFDFAQIDLKHLIGKYQHYLATDDR